MAFDPISFATSILANVTTTVGDGPTRRFVNWLRGQPEDEPLQTGFVRVISKCLADLEGREWDVDERRWLMEALKSEQSYMVARLMDGYVTKTQWMDETLSDLINDTLRLTMAAPTKMLDHKDHSEDHSDMHRQRAAILRGFCESFARHLRTEMPLTLILVTIERIEANLDDVSDDVTVIRKDTDHIRTTTATNEAQLNDLATTTSEIQDQTKDTHDTVKQADTKLDHLQAELTALHKETVESEQHAVKRHEENQTGVANLTSGQDQTHDNQETIIAGQQKDRQLIKKIDESVERLEQKIKPQRTRGLSATVAVGEDSPILPAKDPLLPVVIEALDKLVVKPILSQFAEVLREELDLNEDHKPFGKLLEDGFSEDGFISYRDSVETYLIEKQTNLSMPEYQNYVLIAGWLAILAVRPECRYSIDDPAAEEINLIIPVNTIVGAEIFVASLNKKHAVFRINNQPQPDFISGAGMIRMERPEPGSGIQTEARARKIVEMVWKITEKDHNSIHHPHKDLKGLLAPAELDLDILKIRLRRSKKSKHQFEPYLVIDFYDDESPCGNVLKAVKRMLPELKVLSYAGNADSIWIEGFCEKGIRECLVDFFFMLQKYQPREGD